MEVFQISEPDAFPKPPVIMKREPSPLTGWWRGPPCVYSRSAVHIAAVGRSKNDDT